jgi:hypothetical protein
MVLLAKICTPKSDRGMHKRNEILGIRIPYLVCILRVGLRQVAGLLRLLHPSIEGTHSSQSGGPPSLLPRHASWISIVDVRARLPLVVDGAFHDLDGGEVEVHSKMLTIPDVGSKCPL